LNALRSLGGPAVAFAGWIFAATVNFGCQSLTATAPAVSLAIAESGKDEGFSVAYLAAGRNLLLTRCISCHSLVPISKYSSQRWPEVVASMSERAGLDETQRAQITAYVVAARRSLP
jgi:mono/diheme cytochrome c family protein